MGKQVISIIGIGEVGGVTTSLLLSKFTGTLFNLMDINIREIKGKLLDLEHAATARNNTIIINSDALLCQSNIIIYSAGYGNAPGMDRNSVAQHNKKIVDQVFKGKKLLKSAIIIVVTNPVELISCWIRQVLHNEILVVGTGTSLDTFRLQYLLSKHLKIDIDGVQVLVLGEHGAHMTPIYSQSQLANKNTDSSIDSLLSEEEKEQLLSDLKMAATKIRATESATKYGVSECVCQIVEGFVGENKKPKFMPLSININSFYKELLEIQEDIFISLPCSIARSTVTIVNLLELSKKEVFALKQAAMALEGLLKE